MIYVISDLHGYPLPRFLQLLKKANFSEDDFLFILGDVIDRNGDGGVAMLRWLLWQPNVELLLGGMMKVICTSPLSAMALTAMLA